MKQKCSKCGKIKVLNEKNFPIKNSVKSGFDSQCKACKRAYDSERYIEKKAQILKQKKEYYLKKKSLDQKK